MSAKLVRGCFHCHAPHVSVIDKQRRRFFHCSSCGETSGRCFELSGPTKVKKVSRGLMHYSAGMLIEKDGKYLIQRRAAYPFLYATLGGHVDKGESWSTALAREMKEECGLTINKKKLIFKGIIAHDSCSRGADQHDWRLYLVEPKGIVKKNNESLSLRWLTKKQMARLKFTPPVEYIFKRLGFFLDVEPKRR